jgi:cellulose synthase/poly-beta-1,6-N-acetylglucosamine synthase-like glycosyltransferase
MALTWPGWVIQLYHWLYAGLRPFGLPFGAIAVGIGLGLVLYLVITSLEAIPTTSGAGTVPISVVPDDETAPKDGAPPSSDDRPVVPVRVFSKDGGKVVRMRGAGENPSVPGKRAIRFVAVLTGAFAAFSVPLLLYYPVIFAEYDHIVAGVGIFLYWPLTWPGVYAVSVQALVVPDYIFPMYIAFMAAFVIASGLAFNRPRYTGRRRRRALVTIVIYICAELVIDALFFTVPGATLRNFALLVRVLTGGLFMAFLTFCTFYLPHPQKIIPRFPRDRAATALFLAVGVSAGVLSAVAVLITSWVLDMNRIVTGFTILLLVPVLTLPVFCALARPLYFRHLRKHPLPSLEEYHPSVSIIIPAYNEEEFIVESIRSADRAAGYYPGTVEIIVGNDGSTDRTLELALGAIRNLEHTQGYVADLPHGGKSNALNGALALATGEIVLRLDGDTVIISPPGFAPMISHFADPEVGGVQGAIHPRDRKGWTRKLRALEVAWLHYMLRPASMATRSAEVLDGLFSAFRRADLVELGGWVPWNGEDSEISIRVQRLGYRIRIEFGALALEDVPHNYDSLRKQRVRWSRGIIMANGQHYRSLLGETPEFAGLGVLFWFLLVMRSGVRSLVYVFLLLLILFLGVPGLIYTIVLLAIATGIRAVPIAYFLVKMRRPDVLVWIPFFPIGNIIKQTFRFEAFGTLGPGATAEYI